MIKKLKKGFTIVELVIVIAIVAILAAVLVPTFANIIDKANVSADTMLVRNLNTALKTDNQEHKTMTSALQAAKDAGYDISRINAQATNSEILWDSLNDTFCYEKDGEIVYLPEITDKKEVGNNTYYYWQITNKGETLSRDYSNYLAADYVVSDTLEIFTGLDVGEVTGITSVKYTGGETEKKVTIRTTEGKLTVNAENDTVYHYGEVENVAIEKVAGESYHEYGRAGYVEIATGRFVAEADSKVIALVGTGASVVVKKEADAVIDAAYTTVANTNTTGNVTLTEKTFTNEEEKADFIYNAEAQIVNAISVNGKYYKTMEKAFARVAAVNGEGFNLDKEVTITLYKNIVENGIIVQNGTKVIFDFNGYTYDIDATVGSVGTTTNGFQLLQGSTVTFKNGTLTSSKAQIMVQNYSNLTLENMVLDGRNLRGWAYALSNNNGNVAIKDTTIYAKASGFAFDVCRYSNYPSVHVTVEGSSVINGRIEISADSSDAKDGFSLTLNGGDFTNASLVLSNTVVGLIDANPITIKEGVVFNNIPNGYTWSEGKLVKAS